MFGWLKRLFYKEEKTYKIPPLVADITSRNYDSLAADFFWMEQYDKVLFLEAIGVENAKGVLEGAKPHQHVETLLWGKDIGEPAYYWRSFLQLLVQMTERGRYYGVVHVLQNILPTLDDAKLYATRIKEGKIDW